MTFISNAQPKLTALAASLAGYRFEKPTKANRLYQLTGVSMPLPVGDETVVCWAIDLLDRGFEHDCILDSYRARDGEPVDLSLPAKHYFDRALAAYEQGNRGLAIAEFSVALAIDPANPNSWYSRACVKDQLDLDPLARSDYDKAIELAPSFVAALVNRGTNQAAADEHADAIADYDRAIAVNPEAGAAFLNRGNSKLELGDKAGAIADWKVAVSLGVDSARERLAEYDT